MNDKTGQGNPGKLNDQEFRIKKKMFEFESKLSELRKTQKFKMFARDLVRNDTRNSARTHEKAKFDPLSLACGVTCSIALMVAFKSIAITPIGFYSGFKLGNWYKSKR
jgi:vesicle coat complex subunit